MKTLATLTALTLVLATNLAAAHAEPACAQCSALDQMVVKLNNNAPDSIEAVKRKMEEFKFSKDAATAKLEAAAFTRLTLVALKVDQEAEAGGIYAFISRRNAKVMEPAFRALPASDRATLERARRDAERAFREGNG